MEWTIGHNYLDPLTSEQQNQIKDIILHLNHIALAYSLFLLVLQHLYLGHMGWDHQGRFETSQENHHKPGQQGDEISHTSSEKILHRKRARDSMLHEEL